MQEIPFLTTEQLWKKYVSEGHLTDAILHPNHEDFFISRLEDYRQSMKLPTEPHRRRVNEFVFITNGRLIRGCNLNKIEINTGQIHLLLENDISTVDYLSDDVTGFYCHFSIETIIRLYHKEHMIKELAGLNSFMQSKALTVNNKAFVTVNGIFERLTDEYKTNNDLSLIDAYLVTLCYEIKNSMSHNVANDRQGKAYELTEKFKQLIQKHIGQHQNMMFYADQLNVTPNHLNKTVKQVTGKQASVFISEMLVLEAKVLLKHSEQTISEVAYKLGFADQSYFSRFFKKETGMTPIEFRKND